MYTILSTSIVFLIKVSTQTMSTMVFEHCVLSPPCDRMIRQMFFSQSQYKVFFLQILKSTFVIFSSIFGRPAHQTPAYIIFFPICQISAIVIG